MRVTGVQTCALPIYDDDDDDDDDDDVDDTKIIDDIKVVDDTNIIDIEDDDDDNNDNTVIFSNDLISTNSKILTTTKKSLITIPPAEKPLITTPPAKKPLIITPPAIKSGPVPTTTTKKSIINLDALIKTSKTKTSKRVGIENCGATCYFNSLLQLLYTIPELRDIIEISFIKKTQQEIDTLKTQNSSPLNIILASYNNNYIIIENLINIFKLLKKHEDSNIGPVPDNEICQLIKNIGKIIMSDWKIGRHEDAQEFLSYILTCIKELIISGHNEFKKVYNLYTFFAFEKLRCSQLFNSQLFDHSQPPHIIRRHQKEDSSFILQIELKSTEETIQSLINSYFQEELLNESEKLYDCDKGYKTIEMNIPTDLKYVIIHLKRFKYKDGKSDKNQISVTNIEEISLPSSSIITDKYFNKVEDYDIKKQDIKFKLEGAIIHIGTSVSSGHYVYVLYKDGKISKEFDDPRIYDNYSKEPINENAYLLLYRRVQVQQVQPGGSINTISKIDESKWKNKYLKYKQKYLNLVKEI
jgi:ubiquitin C-terminal hydrolase